MVGYVRCEKNYIYIHAKCCFSGCFKMVGLICPGAILHRLLVCHDFFVRTQAPLIIWLGCRILIEDSGHAHLHYYPPVWQVLVWKVLDYGTMSEPEKQMLVSEVNLLRELKHPNIVRYFDRIIDRSNTTLYIVMEYCECGDLASLISRCRRDRHAHSHTCSPTCDNFGPQIQDGGPACLVLTK